MVASVAFAVILVSGLAVYAASQSAEALYHAGDGEDALADAFNVTAAAEGVDVLLAVQGFVASHALGCASAGAAVAGEVASLSERQSYGNLSVRASAEVAAGGEGSDNMTALRPYGGWAPGELDVALRFEGSGSAGPGVSFDRTETHYAHLGFRLEAASTDCMDAAGAVAGALRSAGPLNCTSSSVGRVIGEVEGPQALADAADGFRLHLSYSVARTSSCEVSFLVTVSQGAIQGPGGEFTARLEEGGSVSLPSSS